MAVFVADCPRCGSSKMTFDIRQTIFLHLTYNWKRHYEAFGVCRNCSKSTVFVISQKNIDDEKFLRAHDPTELDTSLNPHFEYEGFISIKDMGADEAPEYVPAVIKNAFEEGARSLVTGSYNAAGAMFRLAVDLSTRPLLPTEEIAGLNNKTRRDLGLRLPWLFENGKLPADLRDLSTCIREDGNDAAHAGTLKKEDALDLLDFTTNLLERLFTEPRRLEIAKERREARRTPKTK